MNIHDANQGIQRHKKPNRVGRGPGSGQGKTAGRGTKGQGQMAGTSKHPTFQGGAMPLVRRVPKRGFNNAFALKVQEINVGELSELFDVGTEITPALLEQHHLVRGRYDVLKVLGDGDVTKALKVSAHRFSKSAEEKIKAAGGTVTILPGRVSVEEKKAAKKAAKQNQS